MTPQSVFLIVAPVTASRLSALRVLLDGMNFEPGIVDPQNPIVPFSRFEQLHYARLVLIDDATMADLEQFGLPRPALPTQLALLGECDGSAGDFLAELVQRAESGLRQIFFHCEGFALDTDLSAWIAAHSLPSAAVYVNRVGRTVGQVQEEAALARALAAQLEREPPPPGASARERREALVSYVRTQVRGGRLRLTPIAPTPFFWWLWNVIHAIAIPLIGLVLLPLLIVASPLIIYLLRTAERTDIEYCPRPSASAVLAMQKLEDHDLTNSFTAVGPVKPGLFRKLLLRALLIAIDYGCRHIFNAGHLARVQTIHFARWAYLDDGARVLFISNYDGSHEAYMDDFINKVAWGLNLVFSNGFGWPRTDWLVCGGARHELPFKYYQRRHQIPTQVWYKAYPGLTLSDLERNRRIRDGVDAGDMDESTSLAWLRLL
jgi:hypothetical protein